MLSIESNMNIIKLILPISILIYIGMTLFVLMIIDVIFSTPFEYPLFYYWQYDKMFDGFLKSWPIFLWASVITLCSLLLIDENTLKTENIWYARLTNNESSLFQCFIISLLIGIVEEIYFRWLAFYTSILGNKMMNFCLFGYSQWFYLNLEAPFINFIFIKRLGWLLYDQAHWSIGSAAIVANAKFRDEHAYLGLFGYYNSWCIGFFLFWIMIHYGLLSAMLSHAFYDFIIFSMYYIHGVVQRRQTYLYQQYDIFRDISSSNSRLTESV